MNENANKKEKENKNANKNNKIQRKWINWHLAINLLGGISAKQWDIRYGMLKIHLLRLSAVHRFPSHYFAIFRFHWHKLLAKIFIKRKNTTRETLHMRWLCADWERGRERDSITTLSYSCVVEPNRIGPMKHCSIFIDWHTLRSMELWMLLLFGYRLKENTQKTPSLKSNKAKKKIESGNILMSHKHLNSSFVFPEWHI